MSRKFHSIVEAKAFAAFGAGVDPETFVEIAVLSEDDVQGSLNKHSSASEVEKNLFLDNVERYRRNNKGFKCKNMNEIVFYVFIGPFRGGFDCFVCDETRIGMRL